MTKTKAILFDFDGVICESVDIKTGAFRKLFEAFPNELERIIAYHLHHGGLSRYEKFKVIYRDFLKKELSDEESQKLGQKFSRLCFAAVVRAPLVAGAFEFLKLNQDKYKFFIVSGTPQDEVKEIAREKGLDVFFEGIYGSPATKERLIKKILKEHHLKAGETVFVGDSMTDYEGAKAAGVSFIGRVPLGETNPFIDLTLRGLVQDLQGLEQFFQQEFESPTRPELSQRTDE